MLIQCQIKEKELQEFLQEKHPDCSIFGYMTCPICKKHLHGHGWRQRFVQDSNQESYKIWIHRKRCTSCKKTFTLLPEFLHVLKIYSLKVILDVLKYKAENKHFTTTIKVSLRLQRIWYKQFVKRCRIGTDFSHIKQNIENSQIIASPLYVHALKNPANMTDFEIKNSKSHHRLDFYIPP